MTNFKCKHCIDGRYNEIGEKLYFCELCAKWKNYTLGECIGNCKTQERFWDENEMEAKEDGTVDESKSEPSFAKLGQ